MGILLDEKTIFCRREKKDITFDFEYAHSNKGIVYRPFDGCDEANGSRHCQECMKEINLKFNSPCQKF